MNRNEREFNQNHPGKRIEIMQFLKGELRRLKQIGFPDYDLSNLASSLTKHVINILEE